MKIISQINDLLNYKNTINSKSIGLVPTMGALHDGHLSLIDSSYNVCDITIVTIFVNPMQFSINEDLNNYPSSIDNDIDLLNKLDVDVLFMPTKSTMYPKGFSTYVGEKEISLINEGKSRPIFFQGVLTIVSKLFNIVQPTHAFFGQKDAQQLFVVRKLVEDMNYNVNIIDCPTIRCHNGLAMSSRNKYFTNIQAEEANIVYSSLCKAVDLIKSGELSSATIKKEIECYLVHPSLSIDYISIVDKNSFTEIRKIEGDIILLIAVVFYKVRLIDNIYYSCGSI